MRAMCSVKKEENYFIGIFFARVCCYTHYNSFEPKTFSIHFND